MSKQRENNFVPKLRFPEFRDAEEWANKPMGEVYSFKGNNSLSRDKLNYESGLIKNRPHISTVGSVTQDMAQS